MAENTIIAWCDFSHNFWIGCQRWSSGCERCYAELLVKNRMGRPGLWGPAKTTRRARTSVANWNKPRRWNRECANEGIAKRVFALSLGDFFEDHHDCNAMRGDAWQLIRDTPYLWWLLLTKRPENIADMLPDDWGPGGYVNVHLGTSIENMKVSHRAATLARIPAVARFISYEPALGPLDDMPLDGLDQIIVGGESGPGFRPMDLDWARSMRRRCDERNISFFWKQSAAIRTEMGTTLDGETVRHYPVPRCLVPGWPEYRLPAPVRAAYRERVRRDRETYAEMAARETTTPTPREREPLPLFEG